MAVPRLVLPSQTAPVAYRPDGLSDTTIWSDAGKAHIARWLADQFNVSDQVIERRIEKDGLWPAPEAP